MINGFKEIPGYPEYGVSREGEIYSEKTNKILKKSLDRGGYHLVTLCNNGKKTSAKVHRLVASAYIDNPLNKPDVNHKDGKKTHNHADNLEWATKKENMQHAFNTGLKCREKVKMLGFKNRKLTMEVAAKIRTERKPGVVSIPKLAEMYRVSEDTIKRIIYNKSYVEA